MITLGYRLEFSNNPPTRLTCQISSLSPAQAAVMDQEIHDLLGKEVIEACLDSDGFFSPVFIVPKKDGGWRPIINLKALNQFLRTQHFKMENIYTLRDILKQGDYMGKIDLKDAYFSVKIFPDHKKFLRFRWRGVAYQYKALPFGFATAPRVFSKIMQEAMKILREKSIRLIQYLDDILILASSPDQLRKHTRMHGSTVPANTGFHPQLQEVCVRTGSSDRIPRIQGGLSENEDSPSSTESEKYNEGMQESSSSEDSVCSQTSSPHWEDDSCNSGNLTGSSSLQSSSTAEEPNPVIQQTELLGNRNLGQRIQDRPQVVEFPSPKPQRENTCHPNGKLNDRIGCIDQGLGCILPGKESRRPLADDGKEAAHKSIGVEIGIPSAANVCVQQDQHSRASTNRQQNRHCIHQSEGRNTLKASVGYGMQPLELVPQEKHNSTSGAHSGSGEHPSGPGFPRVSRPLRLDVVETGFSQDSNQVGADGYVDLFAARHNHQIRDYYSYRPDPGAIAVDAFSQN